jgi:hypothetical protein
MDRSPSAVVGTPGDGMKTERKKAISRIMVEDGDLILEALKQGVRDAMIRHKQAGLLVVIWRDGKIEWVMPEDLGYWNPDVH